MKPELVSPVPGPAAGVALRYAQQLSNALESDSEALFGVRVSALGAEVGVWFRLGLEYFGRESGSLGGKLSVSTGLVTGSAPGFGLSGSGLDFRGQAVQLSFASLCPVFLEDHVG